MISVYSMRYMRTPSVLKIILAVSFFGLPPIVATAGSISIPTDWVRVTDTIQLYDANYAKTVCPKCRAKAEDVAKKAKRLRRYLEAINKRSLDFPNNMAGIMQTRRDQARFKKDLHQRLADLAAVKKQFKALMADIKQIQLDTGTVVGTGTETELTKSQIPTQVVNTGRYFIETALRITEYFVNGKPANSLTEDKNGESSLENIGKNIKEVNAFTALSKNGQALKLYAKAMRLEKAIRQLQELIKITRENNVTPAEFRQLDSLYSAFNRALAEQALCEKKYRDQCKKTDDSIIGSTGSKIDWSEFGLVDRSAIDIKDLIAEPMPGLIPGESIDPLESTSGLLPDSFSFQKPAAQETQPIEPETGNDDVTQMNPSDEPSYPVSPDKTLLPPHFDLGAPQGIPRPAVPALSPKMAAEMKKLEGILKVYPNITPTKFRTVCETVAQICERYRDGPAREKCLASKDLAQEAASCRAEQAGKTCRTRCNSVKDRIRAGEVIRRLSLNEIRKQVPFTTQNMNLRLYAQEAEILSIKQQLEKIVEGANTPQLVLYQNPKTLQLLVADPADIGIDSEFIPLAPMAIFPVGEALERQKALTVDLAEAQDNLKTLGKEALNLHQRLAHMLEYWRLDATNADCTAANAEKMRKDCQTECEGGPAENLYQFTEGLMSYSSCYSSKIELPLVKGVKNFYVFQIYLDATVNQ